MNNDTENVPITLRVPIDLRDRIDKEAQQAGQNRTQFIIEAIHEHLNSPKTHQNKKFFPFSDRSIGTALNLAQQQLDHSFIDGLAEQQIALFQSVIKEVPYEVKMRIFLDALQYFKQNLKKAKDTKNLDPDTTIEAHQQKHIRRLERTVPIFQGLVDSIEETGPQGEDHRLYAYLAYALAYKTELNQDFQLLKKAKNYLEKAIHLRNQIEYEDAEFYWYEVKKSILEVQTDFDFAAKKESSEETLKSVNSNLNIARRFNIKVNKLMQEIESDDLEPTHELSEEKQTSISEIIKNNNISISECNTLKQWLRINQNGPKKSL
jgi:uncharacterized protein (DUF1778 family)